MSSGNKYVNRDIYEYLRKFSSSEDEFLNNLRKHSRRNRIPDIAISPEQGSFLQFFIKSINAEKILEIGTLAGYSAITMARALPENGKLITIETNKFNAKYAQAKFLEAELSDKIELVNANAMEFLKDYKPDFLFDFVFLDADKENYINYLDVLLPLIREKGILAVDNAFAFGLINEKDSSKIESGSIYKIREFNKYFINHPNFFPVTIVPVGDGMIMGIKQSKK